MLNSSIITACIPSIKRFLADIQSGLMAVNISEPYELTHSGGKITGVEYGKGTGMFGSNRGGSRVGITSMKSNGGNSAIRSRGEKDHQELSEARYGNKAQVKVGSRNPRTTSHGNNQIRETESVKGLTDDVIMLSTEYHVEYEDAARSERQREGKADEWSL